MKVPETNRRQQTEARKRYLPARPISYFDDSYSDDTLEIFDDCDFAIHPRRKSGQPIPPTDRGPVILTRSLLENYFGMPLIDVAKNLVMFNPLCTIRGAELICM